jgi:hypothetical protein
MFQIPIVNIWPPEAGGGCPCFLICRKVCKVIWMLLDFWSIQYVWLVGRVLQLSHVNGMFISVAQLLYNFRCHCYDFILRCVEARSCDATKYHYLQTFFVDDSACRSILNYGLYPDVKKWIRREYMFAVQTAVSPCHLIFRFWNSPCRVF